MRTPDIEIDGWMLDDGEERSRLFPESFELPPVEIRSALEPGDFAKLLFRIAIDDAEAPEMVERMWVLIRERTDAGWFGRLENTPAIPENSDFWLGDEIPFEARHVIDVRRGDAQSREDARAAPRNAWPR